MILGNWDLGLVPKKLRPRNIESLAGKATQGSRSSNKQRGTRTWRGVDNAISQGWPAKPALIAFQIIVLQKVTNIQ